MCVVVGEGVLLCRVKEIVYNICMYLLLTCKAKILLQLAISHLHLPDKEVIACRWSGAIRLVNKLHFVQQFV